MGNFAENLNLSNRFRPPPVMQAVKNSIILDWGYFKINKRWLQMIRGGVLSGKVGTGMCAQIGCFFGLSGFPMAPFLFENWFRNRSYFWKMHTFRWIFPFSLPIGCQKVLMHPNLYGKKYWLVLKRVLQEGNGLVIGCKFASSLV